MAAGGVDSVILGAPVGEFGMIHTPADYAQPWFDEAGGLFPAWHIMRGIYASSGKSCRAVETSEPGSVQALAFGGEGGVEVWIANLTGDARNVTIAGPGLQGARVAVLDANSFEVCAASADGLNTVEQDLAGDTLQLAGYAVARMRATS